jgi:hypothetical protein
MDEQERNKREREREDALRRQLDQQRPGAAESTRPLAPETLDAVQRARDLAERQDPDATRG